MPTQRDKKQALQLTSFGGGKNEFDGLMQEGQLSDVENMEFFHGELRTRNGQKLIGHASQFGVSLMDVGGTLYDTQVTVNIHGQTEFYVSGAFQHDGTNNREGWKCSAFMFDIVDSSPNTNRVVKIYYYSAYQYENGLDPKWVELPHQQYDVSFNTNNGSSTYYDNPAKGDPPFNAGLNRVLYLIDVPSFHNGTEGYDFYADWLYHNEEPTNQRAFWLKFEITGGTLANPTQVRPPVAFLPLRPQAMVNFQTREFGNTTLIARPRIGAKASSTGHDKTYAFQDVVRVTNERSLFEEMPSALGDFSPADLVSTSGLKLTRWVSERITSTDRTSDGLVITPNEQFVYFPQTSRIVLSTNEGPASLLRARGAEGEFSTQTQIDNGDLVFTEFPDRDASDRVDFAGLPIMKDLGQPTAIGKYENRLFIGYGDGTYRWGFTSPNEDVFPTESFSAIQDDNPIITAMVEWSSFLAIFTNDSIWVVEPDGNNQLTPSGIQNYLSRKLVSGVGTVSKAAIVEVEGSLWFLARDGIYSFDGSGSPQKLTKTIQKTFDTGLNISALPYACAVYHKSKRQVWFSVAATGNSFNDTIIVIDLNTGGIFIQKGINAEQFAYDDVNNVVYSADFLGRVWQQDYGDADGLARDLGITCSFVTPPISGNSFTAARLTDLLLYLRHYVGADYTATPIIDGVEGTPQTINLDYSLANSPAEGETESAWDSTLMYNGDVLPKKIRRKKAISFDVVDGVDIQIRIDLPNPTVGEKLSVLGLEILAELVGKR